MDSHMLSGSDMPPPDAPLSHGDHDLDPHEGDAAPATGAAPQAPHSSDHITLSGQDHAEQAEHAAPAAHGVAPSPQVAPGAELTMPGEDDDALNASATPEVPGAAAPRSSRTVLLGTAAALVLGMLAAGGGFYAWTRKAPVSDAADGMASNGMVIPAPVRPSQVMAQNQATSAPPEATAASRPSSAPTSRRAEPGPAPRRAPSSSEQGDTAEILSLRGGPQRAAAPVLPTPEAPGAAALPSSSPAEPVIRPAASTEAVPASTAAPTPAPAPSDAASTPPSFAPKPPDPVDVAASLKPAPMMPQAQVDVLALVTQMGAIVRDMRDENAALRAQVAMLTETMQGRTTDFEQRLNLAEARTAVAAAAGARRPSAVLPVLAKPAERGVTRAVAVVPGAARDLWDFKIQAASPGLAVLADANAAPGSAPGLQVKAGETVAGLGRIVSITQRGTAWVVQTDRGVIQYPAVLGDWARAGAAVTLPAFPTLS